MHHSSYDSTTLFNTIKHMVMSPDGGSELVNIITSNALFAAKQIAT